MDQGKIVEEGTYDELAGMGGVFVELAKRQTLDGGETTEEKRVDKRREWVIPHPGF
jgi:hypothetical protein